MASVSIEVLADLSPPYEVDIRRALEMEVMPPPVTVTILLPVAAPPVPAQPVSTLQQSFGTGVAALTGDFGSDVLTFPGLDETFTLVSDGRVVAEALARRLSTPRGLMPFHPDYGLDLRQYLNEAITADVLYQMKAALELECEQDERVQNADAVVTFDQAQQTMLVTINATTASGPFRLNLSVSQVSVDLLAEE